MTVKELYNNLNGNYEEALGRLMNDQMIEYFIGKFIESNFMNRLENAVKAGNKSQIFEEAHAFKGVASNLALTSILSSVEAITEATRPGKENSSIDINKEMAKLKNSYRNMENIISTFKKQK